MRRNWNEGYPPAPFQIVAAARWLYETLADLKAAVEVFEKDCLIYLGTCIAAKGEGAKHGAMLL